MSAYLPGALSVEARLLQPGLDVQAQFRVPPGHVCAIIGRPGSGKSALAQSLAGLLPCKGGRITVGSDVLYDAPTSVDLAAHQRRIGWVDGEGLLFGHLRVRDNLLFGWKRCKSPMAGMSPDAVIDWLHLRSALKCWPDELTPLQRQKVALGRALLASPRALVLHKPLAELPQHEHHDFLDLLAEARQRYTMPTVLVTEHMDEVVRLADEVVILHEGRVASAGPVSKVLSDVSLATFLDGPNAGFVLEGKVRQHDIDWLLTEVEVAGQRISVPAVLANEGRRVRLKLRARDANIHLTPLKDRAVSNELRGRISQIMLAGDHGSYGAVVVTLHQFIDAHAPDTTEGDTVWALLTRRSIQQMQLVPGMDCHVSFKAMAVSVSPRP
jgi:molybdate transport system ATP-binding protein